MLPKGTPTEMPVGASDKEVEAYVKALPSRGVGFGLGGMDQMVSGPHFVLGKSFYVYRRQDDDTLYKAS